MKSKAGRALVAVLTCSAALATGPYAVAASTATPAPGTAGANLGWSVVAHPSPSGQEDEPLRGAWLQGRDLWSVGHAYADLFWQPWGVRCSGSSCSALELTDADDSPVATAAAIDATSATDVWVVGRQLVKHFDGTAWEVIDTTAIGAVAWSDVDVVSTTSVWAVGTVHGAGAPRSTVAHWDGTSWDEDPLTLPAGCGEGAEPQIVVASGVVHVSATCDGRGTLLVRDRLIWRVALDTRAAVHGLDEVAGTVWATGATRAVEPRNWRYRNGTWRRASAPQDVVGVVIAMAGTAHDDRWVVGAPSPGATQPSWFVGHWDGSTWTMSPPPSGTVLPILYDVVIDAAGRPWAVGGETNGCPHPNCGDRPLLVRGPPAPG